jgi:hypothetical protein
MDNTTLKNIFKFLEDEGEHKAPFKWKLENNIPISKEDLNVKGNLYLRDSKVTSLPEGLKVGGNLNLGFLQITSLPEGLNVRGDLDIYWTDITSLPKGLKVGGKLYIRETELTKLSDDELIEMIKPGFIKGWIMR